MRATSITFFATLILAAILLTGCSRSTPETKPPTAPEIGVIDMDKAIEAHRRYPEWKKIKQQGATLNQQLAAITRQASDREMSAFNLSGKAAEGLRAAAEQEFKAKMMAKQQELQARLADKADKVRSQLALELKAYAEQLEKEYRTPQFNLQLKLQIVRMNEQEAAAVQQELNDLKAEQAGKIAAREQQLADSMEAALAPEKEAIEQELASYAQQLHAEISAKMSAQTAGIAGNISQSAISPDDMTTISGLKQQLTMKQQAMNDVETEIVNDIKDKTAKVAIDRNLEAVLTGHKVNVSAVDVTDLVIAEVKK